MARGTDKPTKATRTQDRTAIETLMDNFNALLAKLDSDGGVTDEDYASTLAVTDSDFEA